MQVSNGHYSPDGIFWVSVAGLAGLCATLGSRIPERGAAAIAPRIERILVAVLALGALAQLAQLLGRSPGIYLRVSRDSFHLFREGIVAAAFVTGAVAFGGSLLRRSGPPLLLLIHFGLGVWIVNGSPNPFIDVYVFQERGIEALLEGANPYAAVMPNIYGAGAGYGAELMIGDELTFGYPYPPLALLLAAAGHVFGDLRYAHVAAGTLAGALLIAARPGRIATLAVAVLLFSPRVFFVYEQSWIEPFVVLGLAGVAFCAVRRPRALPYAFGLLCALKQYLVFLPLLIPLLLARPFSWREAIAFGARAGAVVAILLIPPLLIEVRPYWYSMVEVQFLQPFRTDALSFLVTWTRQGHPAPGSWPGFVLTPIAIGLTLWRLPRTPSGFAAAVALVYTIFFAFNKQAFCNYYYFVIGAAAACVALAPTRNPAWDPGAGPSARGGGPDRVSASPRRRHRRRRSAGYSNISGGRPSGGSMVRSSRS